MITVRPATKDELPFLQSKIDDSVEEQVNLAQSFLLVVEEDGEIIGLLPARLAWLQLEPLFIWGGKTKASKRRAMYKLFFEMKNWIADRTRNKSGIHSFWFVTKDDKVAQFAKKVGCIEIYQNCRTFGMDV